MPVVTCFGGLAVEPLPLSLPPYPHLKNRDKNTQHVGLRDSTCEQPGQGLLFFYHGLTVPSQATPGSLLFSLSPLAPHYILSQVLITHLL